MDLKAKNMYTTFYVVRHGETDGNVKQIQQGQLDFPLNDVGLNQAKERAIDLKKVNFDLAVSSDLIRARKTAEIIAIEHKLIVISTQALRERNFGVYQGISRNDFTKEANELFEDWHRKTSQEWLKHRLDKSVETGEEVVSRVLTLIREVAIGHPDKTVLIVCHGGVMQNLLVHLGWATYKELRGTAIQNTGYFILETDGVDFFIKKTVGIVKTD